MHRYELEVYRKARLWVVTYAEVDTHAMTVGPANVAAWCEAGLDQDPAAVATALLCAWRDACVEHPGPGVEYVHVEGELDLPYQEFCVAYGR